MDIDVMLKILTDYGFPILITIWVLYMYSSIGKETIAQIDRLNNTLNNLVLSNNDLLRNLIKQNNFMLNSIILLLNDKIETAKEVLETSIIKEEDDGTDGDKRC